MPRTKKVKYGPIPWVISDDELKARLNEVAAGCDDDGSSSDEEYLPESELVASSGNSWKVFDSYLHYGGRRKEDCDEVSSVSKIPINDKVLTRNGKVIPTSGSFRVVRELSEMLVTTRLGVIEGAFNCVSKVCAQQGSITTLKGDRPFPFFYASSYRQLKGFIFHTLTLGSDDYTRTVTFVKIGGEADLPEHLRNRLIYLLPLREKGVDLQEDATQKLSSN